LTTACLEIGRSLGSVVAVAVIRHLNGSGVPSAGGLDLGELIPW
jgi:hypothetical protein